MGEYGCAMNADQRRSIAIQKLSWARAEIVRLAAAWQAAGVDTAALTEPLVQIQEALAQLEAPQQPAAKPAADT